MKVGRILRRVAYIIVGGFFSLIAITLIIAIVAQPKDEQNKTVVPQKPQKIGSASVYTEIEATTNCGTLQISFNRSMENHDASRTRNGPTHATTKAALSYAKFADEHMRKIGCYSK